MNALRRLGGIAAALVIATGCGAVPDPSTGPSSDPVDSPPAAVATPSPVAPSPTPRITATPRPASTSACPSPGTRVSFDAFTALPATCVPLELVIAGWWDAVRESDRPDATSFGQILRERVPAIDPEEGADFGPSIPLDTRELSTDTTLLEGRWTELRVQVAEDGASDAVDPHCYWSIRTDESVSASFPPTLVCPRHARVLDAALADPPPGALDACPELSRVIPVEDFVRFPRACFGGRTVSLAGWFDTHVVIGGWEAPWDIQPRWLWSLAIGPVPVLGATSDANDWENLRLHVKPGTAIETSRQNRWVVLKGHYARESEYGQCGFEWTGGGSAPADRPDDADARADCAQAFIAESVRDGEPN